MSMQESIVGPASSAPVPPPKNMVGPVAWLREKLFSSVGNSLLTLFGLWLIYATLTPILNWTIFTAIWTGADGKACQVEGAGACWPFITAKFGQFMYGRFPDAERWRVDLTYVLALAGVVPLMIPSFP